MPATIENHSAGRGRRRSRIRGALGGKAGKAVGITSIAAPVIGFIVRDLKKPDSILRSLAGRAIDRFLPGKSANVEVIDITEKVDALDIKEGTENEKERS